MFGYAFHDDKTAVCCGLPVSLLVAYHLVSVCRWAYEPQMGVFPVVSHFSTMDSRRVQRKLGNAAIRTNMNGYYYSYVTFNVLI